jgi:hypothetical protein
MTCPFATPPRTEIKTAVRPPRGVVEFRLILEVAFLRVILPFVFLTMNSYFTGAALGNPKAPGGHSKEKRHELSADRGRDDL